MRSHISSVHGRDVGNCVSFATPNSARGQEAISIVLAIKICASECHVTGRYFLDPGCVEIATTRGWSGIFAIMDEWICLDHNNPFCLS